MKILIIADIHGNREALKAVLCRAEQFHAGQLMLLGDIIDYGPHSNEVIHMLSDMQLPVICNIRGNHEETVLKDEYGQFSSERGRVSARYTREMLSAASWDYIQNGMGPCGRAEFSVNGKKCLAIHGSLQDEYWKAVCPEDDLDEYREYDYVFSGHSHLPHYFARYFPADNPDTRNKKKTVFINPGSAGQPRNLNPMAQFAIWDPETDEVTMACVPYDIPKEQEAFTTNVDVFYRDRLSRGV